MKKHVEKVESSEKRRKMHELSTCTCGDSIGVVRTMMTNFISFYVNVNKHEIHTNDDNELN